MTALHDELIARAQELARRFDQRNGTTAVSDRVTEMLSAERIVDHLPLSGPARHADRRPEPVESTCLISPAELCPDPDPVLLAPRLAERVIQLVEEDLEQAEQTMTRAAELYEQVGDRVHMLTARRQLALMGCQAGRVAEGIAEIEARTAELMSAGDEDALIASHLRLGAAYNLVGRTTDALAAFGRAAQLADQAGSATLSGEAAIRLAQAHAATGDEHRHTALDNANHAVAALATLGPTGNLRRAQFLAGRLHAAAGELDDAYHLFGETAKNEVTDLRGLALHFRGQGRRGPGPCR